MVNPTLAHPLDSKPPKLLDWVRATIRVHELQSRKFRFQSQARSGCCPLKRTATWDFDLDKWATFFQTLRL